MGQASVTLPGTAAEGNSRLGPLHHHLGQQPIRSQPFSTHTAILFFIFSTILGKLRDIQCFLTKAGRVLLFLEDFAQLLANVSDVSTSKVHSAKL